MPVEAFLENMLVNAMAKLDAMEKEFNESKKELKESKKKYNESKKKFESEKDRSDSQTMTDLEREKNTAEHEMHEAEFATRDAMLAMHDAKLAVAEAKLSVAKAERDLYLKDRGEHSIEYNMAVEVANNALREVNISTTARDQCQQRLAAAEGALVAGTFSSSLLGVIFVCALCSSLYSSVSSIAARVSGGVMCL